MLISHEMAGYKIEWLRKNDLRGRSKQPNQIEGPVARSMESHHCWWNMPVMVLPSQTPQSEYNYWIGDKGHGSYQQAVLK